MAEHIKLYNPNGTESSKQANIVDVDSLNESDDLEGYGLSVVGNTIKKINFTAVKNAFVSAINTATSAMNTLYSTVNSWYSDISSSWTTWYNGVQSDWEDLSDDVEEATENANTQAEAARQAAADRTVPQLTDIADSSYGSDEKILSILGTVIKKMTPTGLMKFIFGKLSATTFGNNDLVMGCDANNNPKKGTMSALSDIVTGHYEYNNSRYVVSCDQSIVGGSMQPNKYLRIARDKGGYTGITVGNTIIDVYFTSAYANSGLPYQAKFNIVYASNSGSPNPRNPAAIYVEHIERSSALSNFKFYVDAEGYVYVTSPNGFLYGWTVMVTKHGNHLPIMCEEYTGDASGFTELTPMPRNTADLDSVLGSVSPVDMISTDYIVGLNSNMQTKVGSMESVRNLLKNGSLVEGTDFNDIITAGYYLVTTTSQTLNMPDSTSYTWWLRVEKVTLSTGVRYYQEAIRFDNASVVKRRFRTSGGWGTWA